jgi:hypothetical protein
MAAIGATQFTPPAQQYYIPLGAAGLSTGAAMTAGANSYIYFVTPVPGYVTSIRVFKASGTAGGTLQAGYTTDLTGATALTTSNFGDSTVTDAASVTLTSLPTPAWLTPRAWLVWLSPSVRPDKGGDGCLTRFAPTTSPLSS